MDVFEKRYPTLVSSFHGVRHPRFERELRVGRLLRRQPPGVPFARLVAADRRQRALTFEAVDGDVLGPKYPDALDERDVDTLCPYADALSRYRPARARFVHRFNLGQRMAWAERFGVLDEHQRAAVHAWFADDPPSYRFAHGDITARNVMRETATGRLVLIDWEWAGWYPEAWDRAFLWYSLIHVADAQARIARGQGDWFWRCALLVETLHVGMFAARGEHGSPWYEAHSASLRALWSRLSAGSGGSGSATARRSGSG